MKKIIILAIMCFGLANVFAQSKSADKMYNRMAYSAAIPKFENYVRKDSTNAEAWEKLATCYRLTNDSKGAEKAYSKAVGLGKTSNDNNFYYAQALMQNENYIKAKGVLANLQTSAPDDERAKNLLRGISELEGYKAMEGVYTVKKAGVNSEDSDFGPTMVNDGIVFTSNRSLTEWVGFAHSWTGKQFYRLYKSTGTDQNLGAPMLYADSKQTKYHDGPVCFNSGGTQMIFTRNNIEEGKVRKDDKEITRLKLFTSQWSGGDWGIDIPFPYNSDSYSCAHPALTADNKVLYFSSDMPGGLGGMDLWKCDWNGSAWGTPINLGPTINTKGNELFPTVIADGTLYFASNAHPGMGGLDNFFAKNSGGDFVKPENMGSPINSSDDDFGIALKADGNSGYFSSNRKAQGENDDIYYFTKKCTNADVVIVDEETGQPLSNALVRVFENGSEKNSVTTDETGKFNMCLNPTSNYEFVAKKDEYKENKSSLTKSQVAAAADSGTEVKLPLKKVPLVIVTVTGRVFNQDDKSAVAGNAVALVNRTTGEILSTTTDANGIYKFENIALNTSWEVKTSKKDCGEDIEKFSTSGITSTKSITIDLPLLCKGDIIQIENIYYDYNKFNIRPDAAIELDKVVALLNKYPSMEIELRSHTDARGKDEYNAKLSDNRAKSAVEYIISKGISKSRLVAKGYGESELLNRCKNGVECDDKEHEQNRRTEFKILKIQ